MALTEAEEEGMKGHSLSLAEIQTGNHLKHDKIYICPGEFIDCTMYTLVKYRSTEVTSESLCLSES